MNIGTKNKVIYWISFAVSILVALLMFSSLNNHNTYEFFNSDALFFPNLYKDIVIDGSAMEGWSMGTTPNYFPTGLGYFIFAFILGDLLLAHFFHGLFQYVAILVLFFFLFKQQKVNYFFAGTIFNVLLALFPLHTLLSNDFLFTSFLFLPYHTGAFIIVLINLLLITKFFDQGAKKHLIIYSFLTTLVVFSNQIYLIASIAFLLSSVFATNLSLNKRKLVFLYTLFASILGLVFLSILKSSGLLTYHGGWGIRLDEGFSSIKLMFLDLYNTFFSGNLLSIIGVISIISFVFLVYKKVSHRSSSKINGENSFLLVFVILFCIGLIFGPAVSSMYRGVDCVRYLIPSTYLLMGAFAFLMAISSKNHSVFVGLTLVLLLTTATLLPKSTNMVSLLPELKKKLNYYPDTVQKLDSIAELYNLKYGLSGYWDATHYRLLSKKDLRVYSVHDDFSPLLHNANKNWYFPGNSTKYDKPHFSFVIEGIGLGKKEIENFLKTGYKTINIVHKDVFIFDPISLDMARLRVHQHSDAIWELTCDMELVSDDKKFILTNHNDVKFSNNTVVAGNNFSGKNSLFLSANENHFLTLDIDSARKSNSYDVSVLARNYSNNVFIYACIKSPNDFYLTNNFVERIDEEWSKLRLVFNVPDGLENERLSIGIYKPDNSEAFLDDYLIRVLKLNENEP